MAVTESMKLEIARLYIATFNRVPDTDGFNYWIDKYSKRYGNMTKPLRYKTARRLTHTI